MRRRNQTQKAETGLSFADMVREVRDDLAIFGRQLTDVEQLIRAIHQSIQHQPSGKEWYSTAEVAEAMGVTQHTVQERWCNMGRVECEKDPDTGKWRIPGHEFCRLVKGGSLRPRCE